MEKKIQRYYVVSPPFKEDVGGTVVLHYLCHLLNKSGQKAYMVSHLFKKRTWMIYGAIHGAAKIGLNCPVELDYDQCQDPMSVTIYPEIIDHNPRNAKNIVRWLLYFPGFHTKRINFGKDDLIVSYTKTYAQAIKEWNNCPVINLKFIMTDIYYNKNQLRINNCHSFRKCPNPPKLLHTSDSICIDGKSHSEISEIFNSSRTFISYDPYSCYSIYASLCGCDSIIAPLESRTKTEWQTDMEETYGLSYGFDDIQYGRDTRDLLLDSVKNNETKNLETVASFIDLCNQYFMK